MRRAAARRKSHDRLSALRRLIAALSKAQDDFSPLELADRPAKAAELREACGEFFRLFKVTKPTVIETDEVRFAWHRGSKRVYNRTKDWYVRWAWPIDDEGRQDVVAGIIAHHIPTDYYFWIIDPHMVASDPEYFSKADLFGYADSAEEQDPRL